jgi:hypothetical protein
MLFAVRQSRAVLPAFLLSAAMVLTAAACAGGPDSAGGQPSTAEPGPGGTTPSDAGPADGAPTTTAAIDGPPSTAANVAVLGASEDPPGCRSAGLAFEVVGESGEAGHQHRRVVLTNTGPQPCTVTGYPGVALLDATGRRLGVPASRESLPVATITLAGGASASASLDQQSPGVFPPEACGVPVAVAKVQVIAPDDTDPVSVPTYGEACPNDVDQLSVRPLQAGRDSQP